MTITILATVFLLGIIAVAIIGFRAVITQGRSPEDLQKEKCAICRIGYHRSQMVERQIGDHRLLYFCHACITSLHTEMTTKN